MWKGMFSRNVCGLNMRVIADFLVNKRKKSSKVWCNNARLDCHVTLLIEDKLHFGFFLFRCWLSAPSPLIHLHQAMVVSLSMDVCGMFQRKKPKNMNNRKIPTKFLNQQKADKVIVAVDVDEGNSFTSLSNIANVYI
ncbi:hypothetical protein ACJIZ3_006291 [Penstemon smallii]|uniref:Uncharacterized protein n=1 Tax=Penstemon smallii TaxID=265156 RepID=A0ABD3S797_9LAMI